MNTYFFNEYDILCSLGLWFLSNNHLSLTFFLIRSFPLIMFLIKHLQKLNKKNRVEIKEDEDFVIIKSI